MDYPHLDNRSLSIVIPMYQELDNVAPLLARVHEGLAEYHHPWELILVDDGSRDGTGARLRDEADRYGSHVRVIRFRRNYGQTAAMQAGQIDAALFDLPTALYLAAVVVEGGTILGQFPADRSENPDRFGLLMEEGNPLKECVDAAIAELTDSGDLAAIEARWLQEATGVPVIE